jgi:hypothetical protein
LRVKPANDSVERQTQPPTGGTLGAKYL